MPVIWIFIHISTSSFQQVVSTSAVDYDDRKLATTYLMPTIWLMYLGASLFKLRIRRHIAYLLIHPKNGTLTVSMSEKEMAH
jgi:hypothetical protein